MNYYERAERGSKATESTIVSEGFKGDTRGAPIMPRDAVSRTANVERTGRHKWVNTSRSESMYEQTDKFFQHLIKSNQNQIVFTIFQLI